MKEKSMILYRGLEHATYITKAKRPGMPCRERNGCESHKAIGKGNNARERHLAATGYPVQRGLGGYSSRGYGPCAMTQEGVQLMSPFYLPSDTASMSLTTESRAGLHFTIPAVSQPPPTVSTLIPT